MLGDHHRKESDYEGMTDAELRAETKKILRDIWILISSMSLSVKSLFVAFIFIPIAITIQFIIVVVRVFEKLFS